MLRAQIAYLIAMKYGADGLENPYNFQNKINRKIQYIESLWIRFSPRHDGSAEHHLLNTISKSMEE